MAYIPYTHRYIHTDTCTHICTDTCIHKYTCACTQTHKHIYRIIVETQCFSHALDRSSSSFSLHGLLSMAATSAFTATAAANVYRCSSWKIAVSFFAFKFVWFHFPNRTPFGLSTHAYSPNSWEVEAGRLLELRCLGP